MKNRGGSDVPVSYHCGNKLPQTWWLICIPLMRTLVMTLDHLGKYPSSSCLHFLPVFGSPIICFVIFFVLFLFWFPNFVLRILLLCLSFRLKYEWTWGSSALPKGWRVRLKELNWKETSCEQYRSQRRDWGDGFQAQLEPRGGQSRGEGVATRLH